MLVQSSAKPKEIQVQYVKDKIAHIRLRKKYKTNYKRKK